VAIFYIYRQMFRCCMHANASSVFQTHATEEAKTTHRFIPSRTFSGFTPASVGNNVSLKRVRKQRERMNVTVGAAAFALLSPGLALFSRRSGASDSGHGKLESPVNLQLWEPGGARARGGTGDSNSRHCTDARDHVMSAMTQEECCGSVQ